MEYNNADNKNERYFDDETLKQSVYPSDNQLVEDYREQETILRNQVKALEEKIQQYHNDDELRKRNTEDKASYLEKKLKHQMSQNESLINALNSKNDCVNNLQNQLAEQTSRAKTLADKLEEYSNLNKKLGGDFALFSESVSKIKVDMKQHYEKISSQYEMTIVKLQNEKSELNSKIDTLIKNCDESYKENTSLSAVVREQETKIKLLQGENEAMASKIKEYIKSTSLKQQLPLTTKINQKEKQMPPR